MIPSRLQYISRHLRQSEVCDLDVAVLVEQDVSRLEVVVDDSTPPVRSFALTTKMRVRHNGIQRDTSSIKRECWTTIAIRREAKAEAVRVSTTGHAKVTRCAAITHVSAAKMLTHHHRQLATLSSVSSSTSIYPRTLANNHSYTYTPPREVASPPLPEQC